MKDAIRGGEQRRFHEAVATLENRPDVQTLFNLRDSRNRSRIAERILSATVLGRESIAIVGTSGNGKSTVKHELITATETLAQMMGRDHEHVEFSWGSFRAQAQKPENLGPITQWHLLQDFSYPDRLLSDSILSNFETQQFNDFNGLGIREFNRGVDTFRLSAELDRIARNVQAPITGSHPAYEKGIKTKFIGIIPNYPLQYFANRLRSIVRETPTDSLVVDAMKKEGIGLQGAQQTPDFDNALRDWAAVSASSNAMVQNRAEYQDQVVEWLDKSPQHEQEVEATMIPQAFVRFLKFDPKTTGDKVETMARAYQESTAFMVHYMRDEMGIPEQDMFPVHNIPIIKNGVLTVPSPI